MTKRIVAALIVCTMVVGIAYAKRIAWQKNQKPPVSLQNAIKLAEAELKKEKVEYFCIGASLARTFSEADWTSLLIQGVEGNMGIGRFR